MARLNVTWGRPRLSVTYPAVNAELAKLLAAGFGLEGALTPGFAQDHLVGFDAAGTGAIVASLITDQFDLAATFDDAGALAAGLEQTHLLDAAASVTGDLAPALAQTHELGKATVGTTMLFDADLFVGHDLGADLSAEGALDGDLTVAFDLGADLAATGALDGDITETRALGADMAATGALDGDVEVTAGSDPAFRAAAVTFTGNGATQSITGVGFSPELVIIYDLDDVAGAKRWGTVASSVGDHFPIGQPGGVFGGDTFSFSGVTSFDADGFTVGSNAQTNASGATYMALCFAPGAGAQTANFEQKVLTNTNQQEQFAHGLGTTPFWVWHKRPDEGEGEWITDAAFGEDSESVGNEAFAVRAGGTVEAADASNITLGTATRWNTGTDDSLLIMFGGEPVAGKFKTGTFSPSGAGNVVVTGLGFQPKVVIVRRTDALTAGVLADVISDGNTREIDTGNETQPFTLDADGFTFVGSGNFNVAGATFRYFAWA